MKISIRKGKLTEEKADILVVGILEGGGERSGSIKALDALMGGLIKKVLKEERSKGKLGEVTVIRPNGELKAKRVLVVGLGTKEELDHESVRQAIGAALPVAHRLQAKSICADLLGLEGADTNAAVSAQAMIEGAMLGSYSFTKYKKEKTKYLQSFTIVTENARDASVGKKGIVRGELYARATIFARELVNTPGEHMKPKDLVDAAKEIAKGEGSIRVKVMDQAQLERMGAGGLLAVNQGSDHDPFLVHMVYKPTGKARKKIALVGKAVTFDSGGLSLKPSNGMETMKIDMSGAAAVLGAFSAVAELAPKVEVHGIFGAVENMPSGRAIRPGDVATALNGKTMEILNTDAEGRVTLADTLSYAVRQKPDMMIDLATLTGACVVALGEEITGVMANDQKVADLVLSSAKSAGENMWQLPLQKTYKSLIKSDIADVKNVGNRWGGALTAGLFLEEFVGEVPWAHLDIAGPSFAERPINSYMKKGATGHGVRTLLELLRSI